MANIEKKVITHEDIKTFLEGKDPEKRIVNLKYSYNDSFITIIYRDENDQKCNREESFYPFLWATKNACNKLLEIGRSELKSLMERSGIGVKKLCTTNNNGEHISAFDNGYTFMFYAKRPMSYTNFLNFFKYAKYPVYSKDKSNKDSNRDYLSVTPQEQFLISTGKRFFKGYDDYDQLLRMIFDLETEGLDPHKNRLKLNGVKLNRTVTINGKEYKNFGKIFSVEGETEEEKDESELWVIDTMLRLIYTFRPDVITAHNGENFDWNFLIVRCEMLGTSMKEMSAKYFDGDYIRKEERESILKLGGEIESFYKTIVPNIIVTDSLHAVRRAQATDSSFLKADLKYSTKYLGLKKQNRVYVKGDIIDQTLIDTENKYAFNNEDGSWYKIDQNHPIKENYKETTGRYIVERYLLDDLWECDKVEYKLNTTNFLICKILPIPFSKCCTMGTAGQWKGIMMAWSYENNLAIPRAENTGAFTGGLSRLLRTGYVENVIKLDYNSLYPSIILTWGISDETDLMGTMLTMLEYVLTTREKFKGEKKKAGKIVDKYEEKIHNGETLTKEENEEYMDKKEMYSIAEKTQSQYKVLGNSFFGSFGSNNGSVFPWKSPKCAERTTCTGRQSLRLMISHFSNMDKLAYKEGYIDQLPNKEYNYVPVVGDSFTSDTPVFIKYNSNDYIDIKPISELINENSINIDQFGREYDYSKKNYKVLCRSGWVEPSYIYRHKTEKEIYEVTDNEAKIEVTEDHSLFNSNMEKIKPSEINEKTELEYYQNEIKICSITITNNKDNKIVNVLAKQLAQNEIDRVPMLILNGNYKERLKFYKEFIKWQDVNKYKYSKTCIAGIQFLIRR